MLKTIVYLLAAFAIVYAAAEEKPKGCEFGKQIIPFGETQGTPGGGDECLRVSCNNDGSISAVGCGLQQPSPKCKLSEQDNSKPYPQCCPQVVC